MALEDKIKEIIIEQLGVSADEVVPEASFIDDLGAERGALEGAEIDRGVHVPSLPQAGSSVPRKWVSGRRSRGATRLTRPKRPFGEALHDARVA